MSTPSILAIHSASLVQGKDLLGQSQDSGTEYLLHGLLSTLALYCTTNMIYHKILQMDSSRWWLYNTLGLSMGPVHNSKHKYIQTGSEYCQIP